MYSQGKEEDRRIRGDLRTEAGAGGMQGYKTRNVGRAKKLEKVRKQTLP